MSSSEAHIDVMSTGGQEEGLSVNGDVIKCSYCGCLKDGVLMFYCDQCHKWVHASCLHSGPPSFLLADNYFNFKCANCTSDKEEFERMRLTWSQAVTISLYNLTHSSLGKQGYFKWKEEICEFIEKHWDCLFHSDKKRKQWYPSVASALSTGNPQRFMSGYSQFGESGWWRLVDPTKPPEYEPRSSRPAIISKPSRRGRTHFGPTSRYVARKRQLQQQNKLVLQALESRAKQACIKDERLESSTSSDASVCKQLRKSKLKSDAKTEASNSRRGSEVSTSSIGDINSLPASPASTFSSDSKTFNKEAKVDPLLPLAAISDDENDYNDLQRNDWGDTDDIPSLNRRSIVNPKYVVYSEAKASSESGEGSNEDSNPIKPMSLYDEHKLLKKLLSLKSTENSVKARCLRRKLLLRQLFFSFIFCVVYLEKTFSGNSIFYEMYSMKKRELGISVFNFDATVRRLQCKEKGLQIEIDHPQDVALTSYRSTEYRILDRFLAQGINYDEIEENSRSFRQKLVGSDGNEDEEFIVSPYTQRVLKPYIRRDYETKPARLKMLEEIVSHYHRSDSTWKQGLSAPIDYSYIRPRHIPTINAMCRHFFWPGVDLSESLQYPDFSVVALYKKMVVGFGFLVPDVAFNEAYISFLLVHPDWQHAGIGSFMLYHLIQTCMGKDVTLHVSASNPAMLMYQRFGFKPEKFQADFYDKYLPVDTRDCTHAFFMRLQR